MGERFAPIFEDVECMRENAWLSERGVYVPILGQWIAFCEKCAICASSNHTVECWTRRQWFCEYVQYPTCNPSRHVMCFRCRKPLYIGSTGNGDCIQSASVLKLVFDGMAVDSFYENDDMLTMSELNAMS